VDLLEDVMLAFGLMAALIGFAGWEGARGMARMNESFEELYRRHALGLSRLKEAQTHLLRSVFEVRGALQTRDLAEMARHAEAVTRARESFENDFAAYRNTLDGEEAGSIAAGMQQIFAELAADKDRLLEMAAAGRPGASAAARVDAPADGGAAGEGAAARTAEAGGDEEDLRECRSLVPGRAGGAGGSAGSIDAAGGGLIAGSIARPMERAVRVLEKVAAGDFTERLEIRSRDEVGQMSQALNRAVGGMRRPLGEVGSSATEVTRAAHHLAMASDQLASGAQQQAVSLEQTGSSLEEMTATVKQNADNAEQVSRLASGARDKANQEGAVVAAAVEKPQPKYNPLAKQMKVTGDVAVEVRIATSGSVEHVKALSGNALLSSGVVKTVKQWKFKPFEIDGKPTVAVTTLRFSFRT
jgi:TonB family protein